MEGGHDHKDYTKLYEDKLQEDSIGGLQGDKLLYRGPDEVEQSTVQGMTGQGSHTHK